MPKEKVFQRCANGIDYTLTQRKVKNINMRIKSDGSVGVSASAWVPKYEIDNFVADRADWIHTTKAKLEAREKILDETPMPTKAEALAIFTHWSDLIYPYFEELLNGEKPIIKVRDMSSRWGSCHSSKKQLTFALRLAAMPKEAQIYVVVHEYCHFIQPNHSPAFWHEVEKFLPDWKQRRKLLR